MFGRNEIVGKKMFQDVAGKLLVTSVFATLQGEGPFRGRACVFVRLAKCQLACSFCDTYFDSGEWLTQDELNAKIGAALEKDLPYQPTRGIGLVITGGEPTLQEESLVPWLSKMVAQFGWVQVESNGIIAMKDLSRYVTMVVSPKCLEQGGKPVRYLRPRAESLARADCLKFVMEATEGSPYREVPDWALDWSAETGRDIFVSPMNIYNDVPRQAKQARLEGRELTLEERSTIDEVISFWEPGLLNMEANEANHKYTAQYAMRHNLIFQVQLHLYAGLA